MITILLNNYYINSERVENIKFRKCFKATERIRILDNQNFTLMQAIRHKKQKQ
jgi:hypothetical protein